MRYQDLEETSSKEAQGKRLRYVRDELLQQTRKEFAHIHQDLKITEAVLQNWEEGRFKRLKDSQVQLILKAFERQGIICEKSWLLDGSGHPPSRLNETSSKITEMEGLIEELHIFKKTYPDSIDVIIKDEAMEPFFKIGDHVAGCRYTGININKTIGKFCIVQTKTGEILVRKVEKGSKNNLYTLKCFNPNTSLELMEDVPLFSSSPILLWRRLLASD